MSGEDDEQSDGSLLATPRRRLYGLPASERVSPISGNPPNNEKLPVGLPWYAAGLAGLTGMGLFLTNFALLAALFRLEQLESLYYLGPLVGSGLAAILTRPSDSHRAAAGALVLWLPALVLSSMFLTVGGRGGLFLSLPEYVTRVIGIALLALAVGSSIGVVMGRLLTRSSK